MMNVKTLIMLLLFSIKTSIVLTAQNVGGTYTGPNLTNSQFHIAENKIVFGKEPKELFLTSDFEIGSVFFFNGDSIVDVGMKFDIMNNIMFIRAGNQNSLFLKAAKMKSFKVSNRIYTNASNYTSNETFDGFFEILTTGTEYGLLEKLSYKLKKPDYNEALVVGSKNYEVKLSYNYYYTIGEELFKVPKKAKKFHSRINKSSVTQYVNEKKLKLNNPDDLIILFEHMNMSN